MRHILLSIAFLTLCHGMSAQSMAFYADAMVNADQPAHRKFAADQFEILFDAELASTSSLSRSFDELPSLSIQYPEDSLFRTITWQIDEGNGRYTYKGYLQTSDNLLMKIAGPRGKNTHDNDQVVPLDQWKGGLIYKILTPQDGSGLYYLLTYRVINQFTKVKTLEPLAFTDGKAFLGKRGHFKNQGSQEKLSSRIALLYSIDANASITYEEVSQRLIFDNLVVVQGRIPGQGPTAAPDGSYKAYDLDADGDWSYVDKLFTQRNEGALDPNRKRQLSNELFRNKRKGGD